MDRQIDRYRYRYICIDRYRQIHRYIDIYIYIDIQIYIDIYRYTSISISLSIYIYISDGNTKNAEIAVSLKYLSNFWRTLEMSLN